MDNKRTPIERQDEAACPAQEIIAAVKSIRYGEVIVMIHDARVVQIEKREKKRFP